MIKLGVYTEDKEDALKKQGEFLAATQFKEELASSFLEEATLPVLSGPEYKIIKKRQTFILTQLRKINHGMKTEEIEKLKQTMYQEMYGLIKEEVLQLEEMAEIHQHVSITRKLKKLKEIISRIINHVTVLDSQNSQSNLVKSSAMIKELT